MSLVKSIFWLTIAEVFFNLSGYIVHSGAGRILGPEDYGRYAVVVTLSIMTITLIGHGVPISMSKYLSEFYTKKPELVSVIKKKAFFLQVGLVGAAASVFFFFIPLLARVLGDLTLAPLFYLSILILPAYGLDSYYFYYYSGIRKFGFQSVLKIVRSFLRIVVIIGLIYLLGVKGAIWGYILVPFLVFILAWSFDIFHFRKSFSKIKKSVAFDWKKLLSYAWPITLFMIFYEVLISLDIYFIKGILRDDYQTGIYNSALLVARIPYFLFYALTVILLPSVSKLLSEKQKEKARKLVSDSLRLMLIVLIPVVVFLVGFSAPVIEFIFGSSFSEAAPILNVLSFGMAFLAIFYVLSFALNGSPKVKVSMKIAAFGMVLNAVLNFFFIKTWGIMGAAWATSLASLFVMSLSLFFSFKIFGNIIKFKSFFKMLIAGGLIGIISIFLTKGKFIFILWGIALFAGYLFFLYAFKEISVKDLKILAKIFKRKNA